MNASPTTDAAPSAGEILAPGVSLALARLRDRQVRDVSYDVRLNLSADPAVPVTGHIRLCITLADAGSDLILDYAAEAEDTPKQVSVNGNACTLRLRGEHLIVPVACLREGENEIETDFVCSDMAVKRMPALTYSLFVPANARYAFPCLDQPSLRARFRLTATLPEGWTLVTNTTPGTESKPLPTYLMAFVAGRLRRHETPSGLTVYHPEDSPLPVADLDRAAALSAYAIDWMGAYTGIDCPWPKTDLVLIPGLRYGGMEHPGCVYLKTERIMLPPEADETAHYRRRNALIHEMTHLWAGDLVTLRWFGDVWVKEALANWATDKIVASLPQGGEPMPQLNCRRIAAALAFRERCGGHPVIRPLANLNEAAKLYDAIIYQQAPMALKHLEQTLGAEPFRRALRRYLSGHAFGCAGWNNLKAAFEAEAPCGSIDLEAFERQWLRSSEWPPGP